MKNQEGYAVLLIVLVIVVVASIGLAVAARSFTSFHNTTEATNSQQAFFQAEAGINRALQAGVLSAPANTQIINDTSSNHYYTTTVSPLKSNEFLIAGGTAPLTYDEGNDLWLSDYPTYANQWSGNVTLYWGDPTKTDCQNSALEVVVLSGTKNSPVSTRYPLDACQDAERLNSSHFLAVTQNGSYNVGPTNSTFITTNKTTTSVAGKDFSYSVTIPITSGLVARVIPLYFDSYVGVTADSVLPAQGEVLDSTGTVADVSRRVLSYQGFPKVPGALFQYNLLVP